MKCPNPANQRSPNRLPNRGSMRAFSEVDLLAAWERGLGQPLASRALTMMAALSPGTPADELARFSAGRRDALLLALREQTFGSQLVGWVCCPECGEMSEILFDVKDVQCPPGEYSTEAYSLSVAGHEILLRLPTSLDLIALPGNPESGGAREMLLQRCLLEATRNGDVTALRELPSAVVDAVVARMAEADPQADVALALSCPACGHRWKTIFDIVCFFWKEIEAWASRVLREVHALASAYGWRETDILAMSPRRRQRYLEMASG